MKEPKIKITQLKCKELWRFAVYYNKESFELYWKKDRYYNEYRKEYSWGCEAPLIRYENYKLKLGRNRIKINKG